MKKLKSARWPETVFRERLWAKIKKSDGCWEWTGSCCTQGYGQVQAGGYNKMVHRLSWEFHCGSIPKGICVLHKCDNRKCVNPAHLFLGTQLDNVRDRDHKGRGANGERINTAKLTSEQVREIRDKRPFVPVYGLAEIYGVAPQVISRLCRRITWRHVV